MKRFHNFKFSAKAVLLCLLVALMPLFNSCKKEPLDISDIIGTVPASAGFVGGLNIRSLLEKAGCDIDGTEIKPGKDLEEWIASKSKGEVNNKLENLKVLLSGESGVDPSAAVVFSDAYNVFITSMVTDTDKFISFIAEHSGKHFEDHDGVKVCGNVALLGTQMWVAVKGSIDPKAIKNYSELSESQSFLSNKFSENIANMTHDMEVWGNLRSLGRTLDTSPYVMMSMGMVFDDPSSIQFYADLRKGEAVIEAGIYNSKGKRAKYLFPAKKMNVDLVKTLGPDASMFFAMALPKEFIKKIEDMSGSLGGNMLGEYMSIIRTIDGTVGAAICGSDKNGMAYNAVVSTDGKPSVELMNMMSEFGSVQKDGKILRLSKGTMTGALNVAEEASNMKGATMGVAFGLDGARMQGVEKALKSVSLTMTPEGESLRYNISVKGYDKDENILLSVIKSSK